MSMIKLGKTTVLPSFDSGTYKGMFEINNEYLSDFWFQCNESIWDEISVKIAAMVELTIKDKMKGKMNPEDYEKEFALHENTDNVSFIKKSDLMDVAKKIKKDEDADHENTAKPKVVILDDNELSMALYAQEYPENFKEICDVDHENTGAKE